MRWILVFLLPGAVYAQAISGLSAHFNDSFVAWDIYALDSTNVDTLDDASVPEIKAGVLQLRWLDRADWTEWDVELGDEKGILKLKWKNDPSEWELRTYQGRIIAMKTIWNGDVTQWRITDNDFSLDLKSRYTNDLGEWVVRDRQRGDYKISVLYANDPRDWVVEDSLDPSVDVWFKIAMVFIAAFHSSPRW